MKRRYDDKRRQSDSTRKMSTEFLSARRESRPVNGWADRRFQLQRSARFDATRGR